MELYACGFNAWNQLSFSKFPQPEPRDLHSFQCILQDEQIEVLKASHSYTLVKISSGIHLAGMPYDYIQQIPKLHDINKLLAEAGNGAIARSSLPSHCVTVILSLRSIPCTYSLNSPILQIVGGATFFMALCENGSIWTWGDARYPACLAREITPERPAHQPTLAIDADFIPKGHFTKIVSSQMSYAAAALTSTNDLYLWGMSHPPGSSPRDDKNEDEDESSSESNEDSNDDSNESNGKSIDDPNDDDDNPNTILPANRNTNKVFSTEPDLFQLTHTPFPLDLHGLDIQDVATGDTHILVLTTDHRVWVMGGAKNGQLGLGSRIEHTESRWILIKLELAEGKRAVGVVAGPNTSFILVA